jgi:hypothetical protein
MQGYRWRAKRCPIRRGPIYRARGVGGQLRQRHLQGGYKAEEGVSFHDPDD